MAMTDEFQVKVPGKLMIAGEYAVLEPNQLSVVMAVSRYVTVTVAPSESYHLHLPSLGIDDVTWSYNGNHIITPTNNPRLKFVMQAMRTVFEFLGDDNPLKNNPFALSVISELDEATTGKKFGLGSSAAVVVGIVKALLYMAGDFPQEAIFKIAALAHFIAQGSGSGADVAASTFGGLISYTSFQPQWLAGKLKSGMGCQELIDEPWPYFTWKRLVLPRQLHLCVGWTRSPVGTGPLVRKMSAFKKEHHSQYESFLKESTKAVTTFIEGLELKNIDLAIKGMKMNRNALVKLGEASGVPIETESLKALADIAEACGGAGKSSGAGGGDCGIALVIGTDHIERLYQDWRQAGIEPLRLFSFK
jgi:phosphomevalonate kinase